MNEDEAIQRFGLPSARSHREDILLAIEQAMPRRDNDGDAQLLLKCLCIQLFSIGDVEDSLTIWRVKSSNFDLMCGLDVQLLCGAGLETTVQFLTETHSPAAPAPLKYLNGCVAAGNFADWTPDRTLQEYRACYGVQS